MLRVRGPRRDRSRDQLSVAFARALEARARPEPLLVGLEHEYRVVDPDGAAVDFREVVHGLGLGRRHLDPGDPFAYRLPSGNVVTCDGAEAEIVLAPIPAAAAAPTAAALVDAERAALAAQLPTGLRLEGHSTHVSVSAPDAEIAGIAFRCITRFGPALLRAVDSPDRCGIWVRPRPSRVEICTDFVDGATLGRVIELAIGAVAACRGDLALATLPAPLDATLAPPREREGWHAARWSFGGDVFGDALAERLTLRGGGSIRIEEHVQSAWRTARAGAAALTGMERRDADVGLPEAFGSAVRTRVRPSFELAPVLVSWPLVAFLVLRRPRLSILPMRDRRTAIAAVPRRLLPSFLELLDRGALDAAITAYLDAPRANRVLAREEDARTPALWDHIARRRALLPEEPLGMEAAA